MSTLAADIEECFDLWSISTPLEWFGAGVIALATLFGAYLWTAVLIGAMP